MPNDKKPQRSVLKDHKQIKKTLKPPLLAAIGDKYRPYSWMKDITPEVSWIAFLLNALGDRKGIEVLRKFSSVVQKIDGREIKPFYANISSYKDLNDAEKLAIKVKCKEEEILKDLQIGLSPFFYNFPNFPLSFLFTPPEFAVSEKLAYDRLNLIMPLVFDRYSRPAVITMSCCMFLGIIQGKVKIPTSMIDFEQKFIDISDYPNSEASKAAASSFRAAAPLFLMPDAFGQNRHDQVWAEYYWERLSGMGKCELKYPTFTIMGPIPDDPQGKIVFRFINAAQEELQDRIDLWHFDLNKIEPYEVVGGLLARQVSLAIDFASSPIIWNQNSAPLFLRAMADVFITLAWILKNPDERSLKFVEYGLSNAKLEIAHRKEQLEKNGEHQEEIQNEIDFWDEWIRSQRLPDLVNVELGNWSGLTTRQMAIEADCLDFYNYVYQPFSDIAHSTWRHVSTCNLQFCENPAHGYHRVPTVFDTSSNPRFLYLTAKYLDRAFQKFDEVMNIKTSKTSAFDQLIDDLNQLKRDNDEVNEGDNLE